MKKISVVFLVFTILIAANAFGQIQQPAWVQQLKNNFDQYNQNALQEKLFVHTDKNAYTAGEFIWFKIYNVDGIFLKPLNISKVVYVEVLDKNQNAVLQTKISMKEGIGGGSFYIPLTLSTGNFILRAYTSWMKNFSPELYFTKKFALINPLKSPEKGSIPVAGNCDIQFFPEGGKLVNGMMSVVAFKCTNQWGKGISFKGAVLDQKNDTVANFEPLKMGMGRFTFKPEQAFTYHIVARTGNKTITRELPRVYSNGYVMSLNDDGSGRLSVTVTSNLPQENICLFAQTRNVAKVVETSALAGTARFIIDKNKLGDGISQITIFNSEGRPVCERLYFKRPAKKLDLTSAPNAQEFDQRKKVDIAITAKDQNSKPVIANLSLSVYRLDSLQLNDQAHILSYLWLSSDLKGLIEEPDYYFNNLDATANEAADNLMLTQGWRTFPWHDIFEKKTPSFSFSPEFNGPIITARITDQLTNKARADVVAYLGVRGKSVRLAASKSDDLGRLMFNMHDFYGPAELVAETNTVVDTTYHIDILSPFSDQFAQIVLPPLAVTPSMQTMFADHSIGMQVQNVYHNTRLWQFSDPNADSSAFYGAPSKTYLLDNYTRFITTEEVMREYVREVNVTHLHDQFHIKVLNETGFLPDQDPLVLIDGVPFFNMNKVFAVDPLKLRRLDVVPYRYKLGPSYENGIFSFTSYNGDLGGAGIDPHALIVDYEGLQKARQFYSPVYDAGQQAASRMPDARNVLYWSPYISTDANGKNQVSFYTSDEAGQYIGVLQGITANGEAGSTTFSFEVK
ncbi:MAG: hypothetical protein ACHQIM_00675 [Sphingobacteriales bacterium]